MKLLVYFILAGYAVMCDDSNNYYVVQMPENDPPREMKKPFRVYWNVPTMQCTSKKIPFKELFDKFGIIQNRNDSFRGEEIAILYDPGLFPALLKDETSGKFKFRNGGVPQEGDLEEHLASFRSILDQSVPDPGFSGVGIIDFESWRPVFRQNFGVLVPYKDVSYEIERKLHWWWPKPWIQEEAKRRFEEAARVFMQTTLSVAKQMRPNAVWGYYGFPYCYNMAGKHLVERCADGVPAENDNTYWLWSESTALYPSVYSSQELTSTQLSQLVSGRVSESARVRRNGTPILPYVWFRYRDGGFLSEADLKVMLQTLYKSEASGFIIWGRSSDVNTTAKCIKLLNYIDKVMGPAIAKYTKHNTKLEDEVLNTISDINNYTTSTRNPGVNNNEPDEQTFSITTVKPIIKENSSNTILSTDITNDTSDLNEPQTVLNDTSEIRNYTITNETLDLTLNEINKNNEVTTVKPLFGENITTSTFTTMAPKNDVRKVERDPEYYWDPPENYTQDIEQSVEDGFKQIADFSIKTPEQDTNETVLKTVNESAIIDILLDIIRKTGVSSEGNNEYVNYTSKSYKKGYPKSAEEILTSIDNMEEEVADYYDFETSTYVNTDKSASQIYKNNTKGTPNTVSEYLSTPVSPTDTNFDTKVYIESTTNETKSYDQVTSNKDSDLFYDQNTLFNPELTTETIEITTSELFINTDTSSKEEKNDFIEENQNYTEIIKLDNSESNKTNTIFTENVDVTTDIVEFQKKNSKKGMPKRDLVSQSLTSTISAEDQVTASASHYAIGPKYYYCLIFYFYSISKCLCEIYGQCS